MTQTLEILPESRAAATPAATRDPRVAVVIVTRDRAASLQATLARLLSLPEEPEIVVVDNGSSDGTVAVVRERFPAVRLIALHENRGGAARTRGVRAVTAPYVAFCDDDSWWEAGSLRRAADLLDGDARLAVVAARVLVGPERRLDPVCAEMAVSPLDRRRGLPGPAVLGFVACGAVVRRSAYLAAGGFHERFGIGGEEELLALDLAAAGWSLTSVEDVVAEHHPSSIRDRSARKRGVVRNALWCAWLRRAPGAALGRSLAIGRDALASTEGRAGLIAALRGLPWVLRERRRLPAAVECSLWDLETPGKAMRQADPAPLEEDAGHAAAAAPDVSVVIPTYRRDDGLRRVLEALAGQDIGLARFEIIVVDDACSATTPGVVQAVRDKHTGLRLRLLPGRASGPATARNIGWRAAHGAVIAFVDDDAFPADNGWLREGLAALEDPCVDAVSGRVVVPAGEPPTDFQRNVKGLESGAFVTCNAFVRREALLRLGGFDEQFRLPYREDSDLQFRIEQTGGRIVRNPRAVVVHPAPPGRFAVSLRLQRYSAYNALLYRKHPERFRRELEPRPPLHYYAILAAAIGGLLALLAARRGFAALAALTWATLEGRFFLRRVRGSSRRPRHLADLALTSLVIPWLSVYWRLRGALRFRVRFF